MAGHDETLVLELLGNIAGAGAGNLNPGLGEDGTGGQHVDNVDDSVDWINKSIGEVQWWGHVVGETRGSEQLSRALLSFPDSEELDKEVLGEARREHLRDEEDVGGQGGLQHDGHVGGVE